MDQIKLWKLNNKVHRKSVRVQVNIIIDDNIAFLLPLACYFQAEKYKNNDMHVKNGSHNFLQFVSCSIFLWQLFSFSKVYFASLNINIIYAMHQSVLGLSFFNFLINIQKGLKRSSNLRFISKYLRREKMTYSSIKKRVKFLLKLKRNSAKWRPRLLKC